jgi:hypothetical protein
MKPRVAEIARRLKSVDSHQGLKWLLEKLELR